MSKLGDFLKNRKEENVSNTDTQVQSGVKRYNRVWLNKVSNQMGYIVSSNDKKVDGILEALNRKDGHCPCGGNGDQFLCPCVIMREHGICKCGLYENMKPINPTGNSTGRVK